MGTYLSSKLRDMGWAAGNVLRINTVDAMLRAWALMTAGTCWPVAAWTHPDGFFSQHPTQQPE